MHDQVRAQINRHDDRLERKMKRLVIAAAAA
jgi:hypothetical protein